jgi:hypothetical protein
MIAHMKRIWKHVSWEHVSYASSLVTIVGTISLLVVGLIALFWAQRTFTQMELDFRFTSPAENQIVRGPLLVDGAFSGRSRQYLVTLDGETISIQIPYLLDSSSLLDGVHALSLEIKRPGGTTTKVAATTFRVDNQPPRIIIQHPINGEVVSGLLDGLYEIRGARTDIQAVFQVDGNTREPFETLDTQALSDGLHTLAIAAEDEVGNVGRALGEFIVDNTPPEIVWIGLQQGIPVRGEVLVKPEITEANLDRVQWRLDDVVVGDSRVLSLDTRLLEDSEHSLELSVWDLSGHVDVVGCVMLTDNTSPHLEWILPNDQTTVIYKGQRLPLGIKAERGADITVFRGGDPIDGGYLEFQDNSVGDRIEIHGVATDAAGNSSELRGSFVVDQNLKSRLNTLLIIGRTVISGLLEPVDALCLLAGSGRPAMSFEFCPPQFSPYLIGARLELDLPSVELFCQFAAAPGMGFAIPLSRLRSADDEDRVVMQPKIGFGVMGFGDSGLEDTEPDRMSTDSGASVDKQFYYFSNAFVELLFSWDLTPVMDRDYMEITLGFRVGLTHIVVQDDAGGSDNYIPAAGIVLRVKGFF